MIENSLNKLTGECQVKAKVLRAVVKKKYPGLVPFETYRTRARQAWLFAQLKNKGPVAKPGQSMHEKGKAIDRVFKDKNGKVTWIGDYEYLQYVAAMCGLTGIKGESCHTQDNGKTIVSCMKTNSDRRSKSKLTWEKNVLNQVNIEFRLFGYK